MTILEKQTYEMFGVLSYRTKGTQSEVISSTQKIDGFLLESGVRKTGPIVTTTYSIEQGPSGPIMDFEILIPVDNKPTLPEGYSWKEHFLLTNALMIKHIGNPAGIGTTIGELNRYIADNKLTPITSGYNVTVKDAKTKEDIENVEIDIYVGINPNIL